jgi:hypothetical protein
MTGLGKWLVVLHTGMSLMAATMGIALFATEPDYNGRLKDKAEQVATQRKSLDLNGAAKREAEGRAKMAQLEGYWLTTEPYFDQLMQNTIEAKQANSIPGIVRNPMTGLPEANKQQAGGFAPMIQVLPETAQLVGEKAFTEMVLAERKALADSQIEYQGLKKQAVDLTLEAAGEDGRGGVTRQLNYERDQLENLKLEQRTYDVETAIVQQDKARLDLLLARLRSRGEELKKYSIGK